MLRFARTLLIVSLNTNVLLCGAIAQEPKALPLPDERYKADLLLVVAHPDDEGAATPYLARALDEHRRIAVVFGTRGSSGANEAGAEQAGALGAIREIEARNALTTLGIKNVWFLGGHIYRGRPRGPPSLRASGDRGVRSRGRSRFVPRAGYRSNQKARTISRESTSLAAKKDLLLSGCRP